MEQFLTDAKRLVHRLYSHDNAVDSLIGEATTLQNKLNAMRQYHEEVSKMNETANHRPRSTLILGSQLENQRIQNLEQENRELSLSLAEHQSALELIMNKYREQVLVMMKVNGTQLAIHPPSEVQMSENEVIMKEKVAEMAYVMRQSAALDENVAVQEIEMLRSLQIENDNLRELLEISGGTVPKRKYDFDQIYNTLGATIGQSSSLLDNVDMRNKDSGIYDNESEESTSSFQLPGKKNKRLVYDSIENLFSKVNTEHEDMSCSDTGALANDKATLPHSESFFSNTDSVENCFRAIITDIQPLDENFDLNKDAVGNEDELIYLGELKKDTVENDIDSINLPQNSMCVEYKTKDLPDDFSTESNPHKTEINAEVKKHFESDTCNIDVQENNASITQQEENASITQQRNDKDDGDIDEFETDMMNNFVSVTKILENDLDIDDSTADNTNEESVLEMLDGILDFDDDDDDDDDERRSSDDDDNSDSPDESLETVSSDEEDANDEFNFHANNSILERTEEDVNRNNDDQLLESPSENKNNTPNSLSTNIDLKNINKKHNSILIDEDNILNKEDNILNNEDNTLNAEDNILNGETSDAESEITVTEEDLNDALSGFDSILDDDDDCDYDDEPHAELD